MKNYRIIKKIFTKHSGETSEEFYVQKRVLYFFWSYIKCGGDNIFSDEVVKKFKSYRNAVSYIHNEVVSIKKEIIYLSNSS